MNPDFLLSFIPVAIGVGGAIWGAASVVGRQLGSIERRFDVVEHRIGELEHSMKQQRLSIQSNLDMINYKIDTNFEYRINANTELIQHKAKRLEGAVQTLSAALERVSDGRYVPRGPAQWPTDNAPTDVR